MSCDVGEMMERLESSFSNPSIALPKSQLIIQPFRCFSYITAHSPNLLSLLLCHKAAGLILQPFRHFTYVTTRSPTLPSLYLRQISFSNPSVASPTSQLIFQKFFRFSYFTSSRAHSPTFPSLHLRHSSFSNHSIALSTSQFILPPFHCFTYVTWRAARFQLGMESITMAHTK